MEFENMKDEDQVYKLIKSDLNFNTDRFTLDSGILNFSQLKEVLIAKSILDQYYSSVSIKSLKGDDDNLEYTLTYNKEKVDTNESVSTKKEFKCPYCGSKNLKFSEYQGKLKLYKCKDCNDYSFMDRDNNLYNKNRVGYNDNGLYIKPSKKVEESKKNKKLNFGLGGLQYYENPAGGIGQFNAAAGTGDSGSVGMGEAIDQHDELNSDLWDGEELKPEVKEKLLDIADRFKKSLTDNGIKLDIKDIQLVGSSAQYNYTDDSDIDLHIIANLGVYDDEDLAQKLYDARKSLFNNKYDPTIYGHEVEVYVEPESEVKEKPESVIKESFTESYQSKFSDIIKYAKWLFKYNNVDHYGYTDYRVVPDDLGGGINLQLEFNSNDNHQSRDKFIKAINNNLSGVEAYPGFGNKWTDYISIHVDEMACRESLTEAVSSGVYSLNTGWINKPQKTDNPDVDIQSELDEYTNKAKKLKTIDEIDEFLSDLHNLRQRGLLSNGEWSNENLLFKELRNTGIIKQLKDKKIDLENKEMSISEGLMLENLDSDISGILSDYFNTDLITPIGDNKFQVDDEVYLVLTKDKAADLAAKMIKLDITNGDYLDFDSEYNNGLFNRELNDVAIDNLFNQSDADEFTKDSLSGNAEEEFKYILDEEPELRSEIINNIDQYINLDHIINRLINKYCLGDFLSLDGEEIELPNELYAYKVE